MSELSDHFLKLTTEAALLLPRISCTDCSADDALFHLRSAQGIVLAQQSIDNGETINIIKGMLLRRDA